VFDDGETIKFYRRLMLANARDDERTQRLLRWPRR